MASKKYSKLFGCNIHDSIRVNAMALKIIDTPEFQRLRYIKQLGVGYLVFPVATHSRFEHSIGVYHLAGKMLEKIQKQYPGMTFYLPELSEQKINLNYKIMECVKIAALCHDIGHGPFSHIFDDILLKNSTHPNRHHEKRSCLIIETICRRELSNELSDRHIEFIKAIIDPPSNDRCAIYQIVANKFNNIDVDKFDYLARDSKNLGVPIGFNYNRLINEFIIDHNGNIAYPKHCSHDVYELFHSRYMMHKKVYSHKTIKIIEEMLYDIFTLVDNVYHITDSINDMNRFCELTDDTIFNYIKMTMHPPSLLIRNITDTEMMKVESAMKLHQNILQRKLYKCVKILYGNDAEHTLNKIIIDFYEKYPETPKNIFSIIQVKVGFVGSDENPFQSIYFYDKKENDETFILTKNYISGLLNDEICEMKWILILKNRSYYRKLKEILLI